MEKPLIGFVDVGVHGGTWQAALVKILDNDIRASITTHKASPAMAVLFLPTEKKFKCIPCINMGRPSPKQLDFSSDPVKHMIIAFDSPNYAKLSDIQKTGGYVVEITLWLGPVIPGTGRV